MLPLHFEVKTGVADTNHQVTAPPSTRQASNPPNSGQTTAFGDDAYPDIWTKAAALLQSIVKNHALVDGNKRLGWLSTAVFLQVNRIEISRANNDDVYDLVIEVAAGQPSVDEIAQRLRDVE